MTDAELEPLTDDIEDYLDPAIPDAVNGDVKRALRKQREELEEVADK